MWLSLLSVAVIMILFMYGSVAGSAYSVFVFVWFSAWWLIIECLCHVDWQKLLWFIIIWAEAKEHRYFAFAGRIMRLTFELLASKRSYFKVEHEHMKLANKAEPGHCRSYELCLRTTQRSIQIGKRIIYVTYFNNCYLYRLLKMTWFSIN